VKLAAAQPQVLDKNAEDHSSILEEHPEDVEVPDIKPCQEPFVVMDEWFWRA
jgi:hypothetical protein